jgi:drug/metabolite transporter (DMT)-like permease
MDVSTSEYRSFPDTTKPTEPKKFGGLQLGVVLLLLLLTGSCNFVLLKILFAAYGEASAFFVSQGINVLYILYGGLVVYPRLLPCGIGDRVSAALGFGPILTSMRTREHHRRFLVMGVLDCFGTFLTAMGAVYVPGQYQTLINQSLIPTTMLASWLFLGTSFSAGQLASAVLIIGGAGLSIYPQLALEPSAPDDAHPQHQDDEVRGYAVLTYWLSNVPMALSAVYKEANFCRHGDPMDVTYLTQWVSVWQMLFGFCLAPLQMIGGVGSDRGRSWDEICSSFSRGLGCFLQSDEEPTCSAAHASLLLGYVAVNFLFNTLGLYLTKHGSAVLNSISYSLLLPLTTILFSMPVLGRFTESAFPSTYCGLVVVLAGFAGWRHYGSRHEAERAARHECPPSTTSSTRSASPLTSSLLAADASATSHALDARYTSDAAQARVGLLEQRGSAYPSPLLRSPPASFQERVIGMGRIARQALSVRRAPAR